jgi:hypothetical protein
MLQFDKVVEKNEVFVKKREIYEIHYQAPIKYL